MIEIRKGMYGLPQAVILANVQLHTHLKIYGYEQTTTSGLYKYKTKHISFTLIVDGFGICYENINNLHHPSLIQLDHSTVDSKLTGTVSNNTLTF